MEWMERIRILPKLLSEDEKISPELSVGYVNEKVFIDFDVTIE